VTALTGVFALGCGLGCGRTHMRLVLELGVREPAYGYLWPGHCRELAAWGWILQGVTEAADRLLATGIQPFLGLTDAFFDAGSNFHRFGGWGLLRWRGSWCLPRAAHASRPCRWRSRLWQPGQRKAARREEIVLQKFLDAFWLGTVIDDLPWEALVEFQRVTLRTMLRVVNGQHIGPLCVHPVTVGTRQGLPGHLFDALGREVELVIQFDGAGITESRLVAQLDPRFLLILPRHDY